MFSKIEVKKRIEMFFTGSCCLIFPRMWQTGVMWVLYPVAYFPKRQSILNESPS